MKNEKKNMCQLFIIPYAVCAHLNRRAYAILMSIYDMFLWRKMQNCLFYMGRVMRTFCIYAKTRARTSCAVPALLISAFVFATSPILSNKFQASRHFLWRYSPVCVGPWKDLLATRLISSNMHRVP